MIRSTRPFVSQPQAARSHRLLAICVCVGSAFAARPAAAQSTFQAINQVNGNIDVLENMVQMATAAQAANPSPSLFSQNTIQHLGGVSGSSGSINDLLSNTLIQGGEAVSRSERTRNPSYALAWNNRFQGALPYLQADMARMQVSQSIYKTNLRTSYQNQASNARMAAWYSDRQAANAARMGNWSVASWHMQQANASRQWAAWYSTSAANLGNQ